MRIALMAVSAALALTAAGAAPASAAPFQAAPAADFTDAELTQYARAMEAIAPINAQVQGGAPTAEQRQAMVDAIVATGLTVERFNAISGAAGSNRVVRARVAVITAPAPAEGSVAAGIADAEMDQYAAAADGMKAITDALQGAAPSEEQRAQMVQAITAAGLDIDRFNAISQAIQSDARTRARLNLAFIRREG